MPSNVIIYQNETKFEIYCNVQTESHHITETNLKVAINTITWVWTKSLITQGLAVIFSQVYLAMWKYNCEPLWLIIHTVTFRGIVNVEKIYCDFFSCDFFFYLSCDLFSCDFFSVYHLCIVYIISHLLEEMYKNQISVLLKFHVLPWKDKLLSASVIFGS